MSIMRLAADENFDNKVLDGLLSRTTNADVVRIQDLPISGAEDPLVLEWVAQEKRILLSHDVKTMIGFAYERVKAGKPMPGLVEVSQLAPTGKAIEALLIFVERSHEGEWEGQVVYLPFQQTEQQS